MTPIDYRKCYLVYEGGQHILYTPDGNVVWGTIVTTTRDHCNEPSTCEALFTVNICSKEEMEGHIARHKQGLEEEWKIAHRKFKKSIENIEPLDINSAEKSRINGAI